MDVGTRFVACCACKRSEVNEELKILTIENVTTTAVELVPGKRSGIEFGGEGRTNIEMEMKINAIA
jgi:hypothetical protein